jgi:hypothetical protein
LFSSSTVEEFFLCEKLIFLILDVSTLMDVVAVRVSDGSVMRVEVEFNVSWKPAEAGDCLKFLKLWEAQRAREKFCLLKVAFRRLCGTTVWVGSSLSKAEPSKT